MRSKSTVKTFLSAFARLNVNEKACSLSLVVKFASLKPQSFKADSYGLLIGSGSPVVVKYEKDLEDHNSGFACLSL